ncbi:MAG: hypothetical protein JWO62_2612 [Acidimicrobiaceae bacterium]|nr:hypothetical protein [Acidimicrobiaceae bacterium]
MSYDIAVAVGAPLVAYLVVALTGYCYLRNRFPSLPQPPFWLGYFRYITWRYYRDGRWLRKHP